MNVSNALIDYYKSKGLGPLMETHDLNTQVNEHHVIYGGGWTVATEAAVRRLWKRMSRSGIIEVNVWKRKNS